ncbi:MULTISPECIES: hypothetical protein [Methylomonas]|uniref:5-bromo-4-chloroindolyl phosphate hydrolysis protein n=1 Tax=Methylomonas koyamae TaxID=702114 RepID=A0A177MZT8_9GAMM|nr:hypothetical protein [Methylomonas koyamae]OAI11162.1 hypothetical protein A1355_16385 [Methylomonas koyamae]
MSGRLVWAALLLCGLAMLSLLAGFLAMQAGLALLTGLLYLIGAKILLVALGLWGGLGLFGLITEVSRDLRAFCSETAAALRRVAALELARRAAATRRALEFKQLQYRAAMRRRRILAADDRKQLRELSAAVESELLAGKALLPAKRFKTLRRELKHCLRSGDVAGILAVREQV